MQHNNPNSKFTSINQGNEKETNDIPEDINECLNNPSNDPNPKDDDLDNDDFVESISNNTPI